MHASWNCLTYCWCKFYLSIDIWLPWQVCCIAFIRPWPRNSTSPCNVRRVEISSFQTSVILVQCRVITLQHIIFALVVVSQQYVIDCSEAKIRYSDFTTVWFKLVMPILKILVGRVVQPIGVHTSSQYIFSLQIEFSSVDTNYMKLNSGRH